MTIKDNIKIKEDEFMELNKKSNYHRHKLIKLFDPIKYIPSPIYDGPLFIWDTPRGGVWPFCMEVSIPIKLPTQEGINLFFRNIGPYTSYRDNEWLSDTEVHGSLEGNAIIAYIDLLENEEIKRINLLSEHNLVCKALNHIGPKEFHKRIDELFREQYTFCKEVAIALQKKYPSIDIIIRELL